MMMKNGIELQIAKRVEIKPGRAGTIYTMTEIDIPEDCVGIVAIRRKYGDKAIFATSTILWGGFKGCPELHIANLGANVAEFISGEAIAHVAIVSSTYTQSK